jgi:hypothetical protein
MKRTFSILGSLTVAIALSLAMSSQVIAKDEKKSNKTSNKESRLSGTVHMISKDTSTITIRDKNNAQRPVVYSGDTKYTYRNKPGSIDDVKEGRRVICLGKFDDQNRLMATRVDIRSGK